MEKQSVITSNYVAQTTGLLIIIGLYLTSLYSYLLFHSLAEIFSIVIACGIFMVAWNSKEFMDNNYFLFLGIAYLFIGGLDMVHTLAYKGMGVFTGYGANLPTQFWIAARYLESLSLILALTFLNRRMKINYVVYCYSFVTAVLIISIFYWKAFPDCFIEGVGLTPFKKISEYIISLILIGSVVILFKKRSEFDESVFKLLVASIVITIGAELAFTFYVSVYGLSNLVGHYFKIISFYLIYKALIETGLVKPYDLLFRNLKLSEKKLKASLKEKEVLLREIHHRVKNNMQLIISLLRLQADKIEDKKYADLFKEGENRIRSMSLIHEKLYQTQDFANINFGEHIESLVDGLFVSYGIDANKVSLNIDIKDVSIDLENAIPCGLIINELVSNSLKYAFPQGREGKISIAFRPFNEDELELTVSDDGVGISEDLDIEQTDTMGLTLIKLLAGHQLDGEIDLDRTGGTQFNIKFKRTAHKPRI